MLSSSLHNEEFGDCATVSFFFFQNVGKHVLSSLVLQNPCIVESSWLKESCCKWNTSVIFC